MGEQNRAKEVSRKYGDHDQYGNSLNNLRANLKLTPLERIRKAEAMARFIAMNRGAAHRSARD